MKLHLIKNNNLNKENFFNKKELQEILNLYGSMVSVGEWKDYGIYMSKTMISFEIYRKATENPLFPGSDQHHYYLCLTGASYILNGDDFRRYDRSYLISLVCFGTNNQNSFIVFINFIKQTIFSI